MSGGETLFPSLKPTNLSRYNHSSALTNLVTYSASYAPATGKLRCTYDAATGSVTGLALAGHTPGSGVCPGDGVLDVVIGDDAVVSQVGVALIPPHVR